MSVSDNDKCMILKALFDFRATPTCHKTTRPGPARPSDQKMMVKTQKIEMQAVFMYHFNDDSVNIQKVKPPNTNNKIGNAIFI